MTASEECRTAIKTFEGLVLKSYKCPAGKWTIGYGHNHEGTRPYEITRLGAELLFAEDLKPIESFLSSVTNIDTQGKFDAMVSFIYNIGIKRFKTSTIYRLIRRNAADRVIVYQLQKWIYANHVPLKGLKIRRDWESERWYGK